MTYLWQYNFDYMRLSADMTPKHNKDRKNIVQNNT